MNSWVPYYKIATKSNPKPPRLRFLLAPPLEPAMAARGRQRLRKDTIKLRQTGEL